MLPMDRTNPSATQSLRQELILEHQRRPRNRGELAGADVVTVHLSNPTCGDEITLHLRIRDGRMDDLRFGGHGCAISQVSASMMTERLRGGSAAEVRALTARFTQMLQGSADAAADRSLGDLRALAGVARLPARIRCALLAWKALVEAETHVARLSDDPVKSG